MPKKLASKIDNEGDWYDDDRDDVVDASFKDYDIVSSPNDFNIETIVNFIKSGVVKIPSFQRNFIWDKKRASKLIKSLLIGLPIPQIFLYEEERNSFLVVDGQQRLMSIYYFVSKRFPLPKRRTAIRRIISDKGRIPANFLKNDDYFEEFALQLPAAGDGKPSRFHKKDLPLP